MSIFPDLCATMPISRECRVTKFTSNIFRYPSIRGCYLSFSAVEQHYSLCVGHFSTVELLHWYQRIQGSTEARWLAVLLSSIISLEEHIYILYDSPSPTPTACKLVAIALMVAWPNLFRHDEPSQNVNLFHILHSQEGRSAAPGGLLCQSLLSTSAGR